MLPGMEDAYPSVGSITDAGAAFDNWVNGDGTFTVPEGTQTAPVTLRDATGGFGALELGGGLGGLVACGVEAELGGGGLVGVVAVLGAG